jgi:hypothetical protein
MIGASVVDVIASESIISMLSSRSVMVAASGRFKELGTGGMAVEADLYFAMISDRPLISTQQPTQLCMGRRRLLRRMIPLSKKL